MTIRSHASGPPVCPAAARPCSLVAAPVGVGLTPAGWALGAAFDAATLALLGRGLARDGRAGPRPADQVTLARAALAGGVAALVAELVQPAGEPSRSWSVWPRSRWCSTRVDGRLARRTGTASAFGARFDMEVDAFLILVLSVYVARSLGAWVLLIGLARYLLLGAGRVWPWLARPTPPRYWAKVVAAAQGVVLTVVAADVLPRPVAVALTAVALALLAESFAHQVFWLARGRSWLREPAVATVVVASARWSWSGSALAWPDRLGRLTPSTFVQLPAEGLVLVAVALAPARPGCGRCWPASRAAPSACWSCSRSSTWATTPSSTGRSTRSSSGAASGPRSASCATRSGRPWPRRPSPGPSSSPSPWSGC